MHVQIVRYVIRDPETHRSYVALDSGKVLAGKVDLTTDQDGRRIIKYTLPRGFLDQKTVSTVITIASGSQLVRNFKIVEEHIIGGEKMQTFEFCTPVVIPGSVSEWETMYVPNKKLSSKETKKSLISKKAKWEVNTKVFEGDLLVQENGAVLEFE